MNEDKREVRRTVNLTLLEAERLDKVRGWRSSADFIHAALLEKIDREDPEKY